jgi:rhodanese-related sulfurtransferase
VVVGATKEHTSAMSGQTIEGLLADARRGLDRVPAQALDAEQRAGALIVDIRPVDQRERDGDLPGAVVIDRNVLEWRLDPSSPHRIDAIADYERRIIIVCNEGYSSSLAAATLRRLGLHRATDLVGGFTAWAEFTQSHQERTADLRAVTTHTPPLRRTPAPLS